ncbi:MAG: FdhF/YdeP family oxidoreductase [Hyphomonadaceae bacterium]|nr:FdhF/YdeP family oxidoreductase [Hyphomonadaceae bacterium]
MTSKVGGGAEKILYALDTIRKIGPIKAGKALNSKNTCKACALGMGGQKGGMVNELGEFPSVCNKSVQAQSTDIQPAIPDELFDFELNDFAALSPMQLEKLGRLNTPIYKEKGATKYRKVDWDWAIGHAADRLRAAQPDRTFFYSSGRSSNEAAFVFQLLARAYGTNNVTNCSYYCHQATGVGLSSTVGTGTATVELADLGLADLVFVIGANPSSNHPRLIHQLKACRDRGGDVVVINPAKEPGLVKFALPKSPKSLLSGGSEIASVYLQPNIGEDLALLKGLAKAILEQGGEDTGFIEAHTQGIQEYRHDIEQTDWDTLTSRSGIEREEIMALARQIMAVKSVIFAWGMGITHHAHGCENVEAIASLALLCGAVGKPGAGLLPLRGHSNVQGVGTIGVKPVLAENIIARIETAYGIALPQTKGLDTMASMEAADRGEVDAAVIMGGNLLAANPDTTWARRALDKIGFRLALTTTLNQSHVLGVQDSEMLILPVTARDEEWEPTTQESMFNFVRLSEGGILRLTNVRPESVILADLASALLPDCPIDFSAFKRHRHTREAIADIVPGMEQLASIDVARQEFHISGRLLHSPDFKTASGKASFRVTPLPERPQIAPFTLTTVRSEGQFNSIIYEERDSYRAVPSRWTVLASAQDAKALGLQNGAKVNLRSAHGEMKDVTLQVFDLQPGNVMAYYPEANALTARTIDPRSRTPAFKSTPIWIEPA